ncbi:MAG TPA: UrcA family protein [Caulobacteraceae bacterium]|jgi:UrcA family protein
MRIPIVFILTFAAVVAVGLVYGPSVFAAEDDVVSTTVSYSDLNLATADGAEILLQRISRAAEQVCAPKADIGDYTGRAVWNDCVVTRIESAVTRLGSPMVTAAYAGKRSSKTQLAGR